MHLVGSGKKNLKHWLCNKLFLFFPFFWMIKKMKELLSVPPSCPSLGAGLGLCWPRGASGSHCCFPSWDCGVALPRAEVVWLPCKLGNPTIIPSFKWAVWKPSAWCWPRGDPCKPSAAQAWFWAAFSPSERWLNWRCLGTLSSRLQEAGNHVIILSSRWIAEYFLRARLGGSHIKNQTNKYQASRTKGHFSLPQTLFLSPPRDVTPFLV